MKTSSWEHWLWLYPAIRAVTIIAVTTLFSISLKVCGVIRRAIPE